MLKFLNIPCQISAHDLLKANIIFVFLENPVSVYTALHNTMNRTIIQNCCNYFKIFMPRAGTFRNGSLSIVVIANMAILTVAVFLGSQGTIFDPRGYANITVKEQAIFLEILA